jgi:hypothetical protein
MTTSILAGITSMLFIISEILAVRNKNKEGNAKSISELLQNAATHISLRISPRTTPAASPE